MEIFISVVFYGPNNSEGFEKNPFVFSVVTYLSTKRTKLSQTSIILERVCSL